MKQSLTILALMGMVSLNEVQAVQHHHHHHKQSLAQEEPKAVTPDSNRKVFDEAVQHAEKNVATQQKTETEYVKQINDLHKKAAEETHTKNTVTKAGRQIAIQNELTYGGQTKKLALNQADPAPAAPAAAAAAAPAKTEEKVVLQNPENSYKAKAESLEAVLEATKAQRTFEATSNKDVATAQDKYFNKTENEKNAVRVDRKIQTDGGLIHDPPAWDKYNHVAKKSSLAQKEEEKKEGGDKAVPFTPSQSYKQKADSLKDVIKAIGVQRTWEATSNADVAAAQEKYYKQSEDTKNKVRVARWVQESGGLIHDPPAWDKYNKKPAQSLAQGDAVPFTPSESYKQKADSLKDVIKAIGVQRTWEAKSNADVAAAQQKYYQQSEDEKNKVRVARWVQESGGLIHDPPAVEKYGVFAQKEGEKKEGGEAVPFTPSQSYKQKKESLEGVLKAIGVQRTWEAKSNADVAAAQDKYFKQTENQKNAVRVDRWVQESGGLIHDPPAFDKYNTKPKSLVQKEEEKKEEKVVPFTPSQSYKEKKESLDGVLKAIGVQRVWEATSNADVAAAQDKYFKQTERQKNTVRTARDVQAAGGLVHDRPKVDMYGLKLAQAEPKKAATKAETPDESRKIFEAHVKEAADVVKTENSIENKRTTQIAKMDAQNVKDTFNESARVRSGRVAMTRGGPKQRYSGGHNGKAAAALAQESGSDASSESDSDEEEVNAKKHQALQQAIAKKQNKQQARGKFRFFLRQ